MQLLRYIKGFAQTRQRSVRSTYAHLPTLQRYCCKKRFILNHEHSFLKLLSVRKVVKMYRESSVAVMNMAKAGHNCNTTQYSATHLSIWAELLIHFEESENKQSILLLPINTTFRSSWPSSKHDKNTYNFKFYFVVLCTSYFVVLVYCWHDYCLKAKHDGIVWWK
jgi:hypothetical protein